MTNTSIVILLLHIKCLNDIHYKYPENFALIFAKKKTFHCFYSTNKKKYLFYSSDQFFSLR